MNITITSTSDESITTGIVLGLIAIGVSTTMVMVGVLCEVLSVRRHEDDGARSSHPFFHTSRRRALLAYDCRPLRSARGQEFASQFED